jgi:hypothetical protein
VQTGNTDLDRAVGAAAAVFREPGAPFILEITEGWLRLATTGGSWLGAHFGRRISDLIASMDCLSKALAGRFAPAANALVDYERGKVSVISDAQATGRSNWTTKLPR